MCTDGKQFTILSFSKYGKMEVLFVMLKIERWVGVQRWGIRGGVEKDFLNNNKRKANVLNKNPPKSYHNPTTRMHKL